MISPFRYSRVQIAPMLRLRKAVLIRPNIGPRLGNWRISSTVSVVTPSGGLGAVPPEYVIAPVGQATMHSPQFTQLLWPIGLLLSKLIDEPYPLPIRPMTLFSTAAQARTQRSHKMHEE